MERLEKIIKEGLKMLLIFIVGILILWGFLYIATSPEMWYAGDVNYSKIMQVVDTPAEFGEK